MFSSNNKRVGQMRCETTLVMIDGLSFINASGCTFKDTMTLKLVSSQGFLRKFLKIKGCSAYRTKISPGGDDRFLLRWLAMVEAFSLQS